LRIEDTDQERSSADSLKAIYDSLKWLGFDYDEGPDKGGPHAPYIQSERLDLYKQKAKELVNRGFAYYCFCSEDRLKNLRAEQEANKLPPKYDGYCLNLSEEEVAERLASGMPFVIRQKIPAGRHLVLTDLIQGDVEFATDTLDDTVLLKSDGFPTYHLANVVDDIAMEISHVIRAVEWLPSLPKHILLYEALDHRPPQFAHIPLILDADKSKLSKRNGAKGILDLAQEGYIPAGVINALALLGWSPQKNGLEGSEVMSVEEIIKKFSLEAVQKSPAIFDEQKLLYFNAAHLRALSVDKYLKFWSNFDGRKNITKNAVAVVQDRAKTLAEASEIINALTDRYKKPSMKLLTKKEKNIKASEALKWWSALLVAQTNWSADFLRDTTIKELENARFNKSEYLWPLRVAITGQENSPEVFACMEFLGKDLSLDRLS